MEYCRSYTKSEPLYKDSPSKLGFTKTYFDFIEFHCVFIYYFNKIVIFLKKKYIFQKKNEFIKLNPKLTMCKMMSINSNEWDITLIVYVEWEITCEISSELVDTYKKNKGNW